MSDDRVKDVLFSLLESERYVRMADGGQWGRIAREAVAECTHALGTDAGVLETLATGILHYVLTRSGTPSRRKAVHEGVELDIVIPGTRELDRSPESALVIQVCCDCKNLAERLRRTGTVQPVSENVWVLTHDCPGPRRHTMHGERATMPEMVERMVGFARERRYDRLGMMP